jgi:hypothetical protein
MTEDQLQTVYSADTPEKAEAAYDGWASQYDADLMAMGYRLPWHFAASVLRHIPFGTGPVLDAGCGTGLQVEPLHLLGWRGFMSLPDTMRAMVTMGHGDLDQLVLHRLAAPRPGTGRGVDQGRRLRAQQYGRQHAHGLVFQGGHRGHDRQRL